MQVPNIVSAILWPLPADRRFGIHALPWKESDCNVLNIVTKKKHSFCKLLLSTIFPLTLSCTGFSGHLVCLILGVGCNCILRSLPLRYWCFLTVQIHIANFQWLILQYNRSLIDYLICPQRIGSWNLPGQAREADTYIPQNHKNVSPSSSQTHSFLICQTYVSWHLGLSICNLIVFTIYAISESAFRKSLLTAFSSAEQQLPNA